MWPLEAARIGPYHVGLAVLVGLVVFFEGYDTFNAAYVIHYVMGPWGLRPAQAGLLVSSGIVGFSLAALFQGKISDAFGRRVAMIGALWMATIFSLATALWAHSFWTYLPVEVLDGPRLGRPAARQRRIPQRVRAAHVADSLRHVELEPGVLRGRRRRVRGRRLPDADIRMASALLCGLVVGARCTGMSRLAA